MPAKVPVGSKKTFGPYKGSKQNDGRKIVVTKTKQADGSWKTTSTNKARADKEKSLGRSLPKTQHVDHKDNNKNNDSSKNLRVMSGSANVAKENKRRANKK